MSALPQEGLRRGKRGLSRWILLRMRFTVETLIRGTPADVEREVLEILEAFEGSPRVIVGTGEGIRHLKK